MSDFLHIDLPCSEADIRALEEVLGIKFQRVQVETIPAEKVQVCPMAPSNFVGFAELKYERH
jgi:hypothetical protein